MVTEEKTRQATRRAVVVSIADGKVKGDVVLTVRGAESGKVVEIVTTRGVAGAPRAGDTYDLTVENRKDKERGPHIWASKVTAFHEAPATAQKGRADTLFGEAPGKQSKPVPGKAEAERLYREAIAPFEHIYNPWQDGLGPVDGAPEVLIPHQLFREILAGDKASLIAFLPEGRDPKTVSHIHVGVGATLDAKTLDRMVVIPVSAFERIGTSQWKFSWARPIRDWRSGDPTAEAFKTKPAVPAGPPALEALVAAAAALFVRPVDKDTAKALEAQVPVVAQKPTLTEAEVISGIHTTVLRLEDAIEALKATVLAPKAPARGKGAVALADQKMLEGLRDRVKVLENTMQERYDELLSLLQDREAKVASSDDWERLWDILKSVVEAAPDAGDPPF